MSESQAIVTYRQRAKVSQLLIQVQSHVTGALDKALARFDITAVQYEVIAALATGPAKSASQICQGMAYSPSGMTRVLDRLEAKGVLRRERRQENRRALCLELTEQGRLLQPTLAAYAASAHQGLFGDFTQHELEQLAGLLQRVVAKPPFF